MDGAYSGDNRVAVWTLSIHAKSRRTVANIFVNLDKTASIKQHLNALASGVLALGVLLFLGVITRADHSLVVTSL